MPLVTNTQVQQALKALSTSTSGGSNLEVFTEFPSDENIASEGFYVARVFQAERNKLSAGTSPGGWIYMIKDRVEMYMITQQVDPYVDNLLGLFPTLLDLPLFNGYHIREHSIEQLYIKNSERYRIVFNLSRLQVI